MTPPQSAFTAAESEDDGWIYDPSIPHYNTTIRRPIPIPFHPLVNTNTTVPAVPSDALIPATSSTTTAPSTSAPEHPNQVVQIVLSEATVIAYKPSGKGEGGGVLGARCPPLYRVRHTSPTSSSLPLEEDVTEEELLQAKTCASKRIASCLPSSTLSTEADKIQNYTKIFNQRQSDALEVYISHLVLWKCAIISALELEEDWRKKERYEVLRKKMESKLMPSSSRRRKKQQEESSSSVEIPKYYSQHPTNYLGGNYVHPHEFVDPLSKPSSSKKKEVEEEEGLTPPGVPPSQIAQRIKLGTSLAYNYYYNLKRQQLQIESSQKMTSSLVVVRRSTRHMMDQNEEEEDGEVKLPRKEEKGGRVALFILGELGLLPGEEEKKKKKKEKEEKKKEEKKSEDKMDVDENNKKKDEASEEKGEEDEEMEDAKKPYTESDMETEEEEDSDEEESDEEDSGAEEEEDDEDESRPEKNPHFQPSPEEVLTHLGRRNKSMSPADIQVAICYGIDDSVPIPSTFHEEDENGENEKGDKEKKMACLVCTTGDRESDLPEFEPSSFARCRFATKKFIPEPDSDDDDDEHDEEEISSENAKTPEEIQKAQEIAQQKRNALLEKQAAEYAKYQQEVRAAEREWKNQKAYQVWRYKCIHLGSSCAVWPSWNEWVRKCLKEEKVELEEEKRRLEGGGGGGESNGGMLNGSGHGAVKTEEDVVGTEDVERRGSNLEEMTRNDEALAKELAEPGGTTDTITTTTSRRTTRRGVKDSSTNDASGDPVVFYGSNQSLSAFQLPPLLYRLLIQASPAYLSLLDMKRLVVEDFETGNELNKIRVALGKLVYKLGKVGRIFVNTFGDGVCWERLGGMKGDGGLGLTQVIYYADSNGVGQQQKGPALEQGKDAVAAATTDTADATADAAATTATEEKTDGVKEEEKVPSQEDKKIESDEKDNSATSVKTEEKEGVKSEENEEIKTEEKENTTASPADPPSTNEPSLSKPDLVLRKKMELLQNYMRSLHMTELCLRSLLLKHYSSYIINQNDSKGGGLQIPPSILSIAADEKHGELDAMDSKYFHKEKDELDSSSSDSDEDENDDDIEWSTFPSHRFLNKVLFRPPYSIVTTGNVPSPPEQECAWYKVASYAPSIPLPPSDEAPSNTSAPSSSMAGAVNKDEPPENKLVKRRIRFRAIPTSPPGEDTMDDDEMDDEDYADALILTEAQVVAGIAAADLERRIIEEHYDADTSHNDDEEEEHQQQHHPFQGKIGTRILLTPFDGKDEDKKECRYGTILGFNTTEGIGPSSVYGTRWRVLVLFERNDEKENEDKDAISVEDDSGSEDESKIEKVLSKQSSASEDMPLAARWATISSCGKILTMDETDDQGVSSDVVDGESATNEPIRYKLELHDYHFGSPAYQACESIVEYLQNHNRAEAFLVPVDPEALGIPDYFDVIKDPMDISTLANNLKDGKYSKISLDDIDIEDAGPIEIMLYGPFYNDLMLIFENAMYYNEVGSYVHKEAQFLKRTVEKKIDTTIRSSYSKPMGGSKMGHIAKKKSVYVEDDSDVDMYEYESDEDDRERGPSKRKRKRNAGASKHKSKEHCATKAIESPHRVPTSTNGSIFDVLPITTNASKFSLPEDWTCRTKKYTEAEVEEVSPEEEKQRKKKEEEEKEMRMLLEMQQSMEPTRRSSRANTARRDDEDDVGESASSDLSKALENVEYCPSHDLFHTEDTLEGDGMWGDVVANGRDGVESVRESLHETFFARVYHDSTKPTSNVAVTFKDGDENESATGFGSFTDGSFPPFMGRIVPININSSPSSADTVSANNLKWEIRTPYILPAIRWVMRGLVRSGHFGEVEPFTNGNAAIVDSNIASSGGIGGGEIILNHAYYWNESMTPFDVLDLKEMQRKKRMEKAGEESSSESEEEVELSAYEKMRAERVERNKERLKALGLA